MKLSVLLAFIALLTLSMQAQSAKSPAIEVLPQDYSFNIRASRVWTDTGLELHPGDHVHIYGGDLDCAGPYRNEKAHLPLPSAPGGALLAKLQPEAAPVAASPDAQFSITAPSHLYLGVNAWQCRSTLPARVHVDWHNPQSPKSAGRP
jgi:hypothetical protein